MSAGILRLGRGNLNVLAQVPAIRAHASSFLTLGGGSGSAVGAGSDWTFLRPGTFATNTRTWWAESIRTDNVVRLPYPLAQSAPVHEKDIAALAVTALTEPGHAHQAYTVYGAESLTLQRQVEHIGEALGRRIRIERVSDEQARAEVGRTMHPVLAEAIVSQWAAANGVPVLTSVIAEKITGAGAHLRPVGRRPLRRLPLSLSLTCSVGGEPGRS
ncbi:hypothetical protein [Streptomyces sp. NPDC059122]|uniref:hypothetical protein n=1 Tax=unclassified Streptomyces TaxID=2593676 RepID=UPI0036B5FE30